MSNINTSGDGAEKAGCFREPSGLAKASKTDGVAISPAVAAAAMKAAELNRLDQTVADPFDDRKFSVCERCGSHVHETTPVQAREGFHPLIDLWLCDRCLRAENASAGPKTAPAAYNLSFLP